MNELWCSIEEHHRVLSLDCKVVMDLLASVEGNKFVDVGCCIGGFTSIIAKVAKERDGLCYSIDLFADYPLTWADTPDRDSHFKRNRDYPVKQIFHANMRRYDLIDNIRIIQGCSWGCDKQFENESVDFIWIDADHEYDSVSKDIKAWYPKLKKSGIIAGHDYEWVGNGGRDAVLEFFPGSIIHTATGLIWSWRKP